MQLFVQEGFTEPPFCCFQMSEEEAFAVLVQLMNDYHLRELYKPCMTELGVCMHQLDGLIAEHLPELHTHFTTQSFAPSHYASAWFLTLFATAFPLRMTTRVMDLFVAEVGGALAFLPPSSSTSSKFPDF